MATAAGDYLHPDYSRYPWKHVNSLAQIFRDSPVLLAMELTILTIYMALLAHAHGHRGGGLGVLLAATAAGALNKPVFTGLPADSPVLLAMKLTILTIHMALLAHAYRHRGGGQGVLQASTAAGALNELVFTGFPAVNNFWHAQAWLMLGPRLPAWQPALYGFLMYSASQSAARLRHWSAAAQAAVAGLVGFLLLFPLDAVCVKFIAYTGHDSDPLLADRLLGVAVGNGMFAAAFPACFTWLLRVSPESPWFACALSTPAMVAATLPFSFVCSGFDNSLPSRAGLAALLVAMVTTTVIAAVASPAVSTPPKRLQRRPPEPADWTLTLTALLYFAVLLTAAALADPAAQKSVGFHQPMSTAEPCPNATDLSASGQARRVFLCPGADANRLTQGDADPTCDPSAGIDQHWYAVCGRPFGDGGRVDRLSFVASLAGLAALGTAALAGCQVA